LDKIKRSLPNFFTFINLSLGVMAILVMMKQASSPRQEVKFYFIATSLLMLAAITDRLDGKMARMFDATSELGKELDSLSDLISFGVATIIVTWKISLSHIGVFGYIVSLIFPIAGAYRLARYNVTTFNNVFTGLPITIASALLSLNNFFHIFVISTHHNKPVSNTLSISTAILVVLLSFAMVCKIKIKKV